MTAEKRSSAFASTSNATCRNAKTWMPGTMPGMVKPGQDGLNRALRSPAQSLLRKLHEFAVTVDEQRAGQPIRPRSQFRRNRAQPLEAGLVA
jgi:hypothetical protein